IVQMDRLDDVGERHPVPRQDHHHHDREGECENALPDEHNEAIDRRIPLRRKRHLPVDDREGAEQEVKEKTSARKILELTVPFPAGLRVHIPAVTIQYQRDDDEISEEDHRSDDLERQVQVSTLIRDDRAFFYDGWIRPGIKKMRSEQDRKKQNRR